MPECSTPYLDVVVDNMLLGVGSGVYGWHSWFRMKLAVLYSTILYCSYPKRLGTVSIFCREQGAVVVHKCDFHEINIYSLTWRSLHSENATFVFPQAAFRIQEAQHVICQTTIMHYSQYALPWKWHPLPATTATTAKVVADERLAEKGFWTGVL